MRLSAEWGKGATKHSQEKDAGRLATVFVSYPLLGLLTLLSFPEMVQGNLVFVESQVQFNTDIVTASVSVDVAASDSKGSKTFVLSNGSGTISGDPGSLGVDLTTTAGKLIFSSMVAAKCLSEMPLFDLLPGITGPLQGDFDFGELGTAAKTFTLDPATSTITQTIDSNLDIAAINSLVLDFSQIDVLVTFTKTTVTNTIDIGGTVIGGIDTVNDLPVPIVGQVQLTLTPQFLSDTQFTFAGSAASNLVLVDPVPTVSEWGLVIMTLLGMTWGTVILGSHRPLPSVRKATVT